MKIEDLLEMKQKILRCSWTELISALFILLDQPPYTIYVCLFTTSQESVPPTFVHIYTIDVNEAYLSAIWWLNTMIISWASRSKLSRIRVEIEPISLPIDQSYRLGIS